MTSPESWASPITTRSRIVLEIASELVAEYNPFWQAKVLLRVQGEPEWQLALYGSGMADGVNEVVAGESALATTNPSTILSLAYRGLHPFSSPQPIRTIGVVPSFDQYVFAVRPETNVRTFEDIGRNRVPLRVGVRSIPGHSLHFMLDHIMEAAGFSTAEFTSWGGVLQREGSLPYPTSAKFKALVDGSLDAVFDEAAYEWVNDAAEAGMKILPLTEATMQRLEASGFRRAILEKSRFPALSADILTVDFSGWPIFVREDAPDALVTAMCVALDKRKAMIPWEGDGPLPLERMCHEAPDTPQDVPLHAAAERFWRERGYIA